MRVLFLSTWFPYPLSQGSKIRAFHLLRALAQKHDIALISFADSPIEQAWLDQIAPFCRKLEIVQANPFASDPLRRKLGWLSLQPSAVFSGYSRDMADRVLSVASDWHPDVIVALTFVTAPYALQIAGIPKLLDIDNHMARMLYEEFQGAGSHADRARRWLAWWKFRRYENQLIRQFDMCLVVSRQDYQALCTLMPNSAGHLAMVPNGVDTDHNSIGIAAPEPNTLVYSGAITYHPNYDAVEYFLRAIFPLVHAEASEAILRVTGGTGHTKVEPLARYGHVEFTGHLADIRPTVAGSWASVIPLRIGGGSRLKILESMALGTPVVSTSKGVEGLDVVPEKHLLIADAPGEFAAQTVRLLRDPGLRASLSTHARQLVEQQYDWTEIGRKFTDVVEQAMAREAGSNCPTLAGLTEQVGTEM